MKRLIAFLAAIAVLMSMSLTSFAAFTDAIEGNGDGTYTAALSDEAATANAGKQTTIVAYKGDVIEVGSIQYIDQAAASSFTFQLMDALTEDVKVVMGGEAIDKQEVGTIFVNVPTPTPEVTPEPTPTPDPIYALGGTIEGYYVDTMELPTIVIEGEAGSYEATITDGVWEVEGGVKAGTYSVSATKAFHTYHNIAELVVEEDTTDVALYVYVGDIDESTWVDFDDVVWVYEFYDATSDDDGWDDIAFVDIDESTWIDFDDIVWIFEYYDAVSIDE